MPNDGVLSRSEASPRPSRALTTAALCGLLAVSSIVACGDDAESGVPPGPSDAGAAGQPVGQGGAAGQANVDPELGGAAGQAGAPSDVYDNVISEGVPISNDEFKELCDERDGWAYLTAACAGSALCKGLSLMGDVLTDHSCKGINSCMGISCVVLPKDTGLTGEEIYRDGPCAGCHGNWEDYDNPNLGVYTVWHGWDVSPEAAVKRFEDSSDLRLKSILVFGTQGQYPDGTPFSNMPAYYQKYSLAEIERTIDYIKTLPLETLAYEVPGADAFEEPGAGGAGGAGAGGQPGSAGAGGSE
jgi:hypothetical protein